MSAVKGRNRALRRALGPAVAEVVEFNEARTKIALNILRRGFWGRFRWLLFGR
jgi:hypothetical protein